MKRSAPLGILVAIACLASGCAVGNRHRYHDVVADVPYTGSGKLAIATQDRRPYVLSGDKGPQFVGLSRGGYGNPFSVTTDSGKPLADDMTLALERSLSAKGYQAIAVFVSPAESEAAVAEKVRATGAERALVLSLREWKSDTYMSTALSYDVVVRVFDASGALLAESEIRGKDDLGGSAWNPPSHAKSSVPPAFKAKLEALLADPKVAAALR